MECYPEIQNEICVYDLPEELIEHILSYLSPYDDFKTATLVCKQWRKIVYGIIRHQHENFKVSIKERQISWSECGRQDGATITERYSHSACYLNNSLYVFGGCTSSSTTFNDLWRFDLTSRIWSRPVALGTYPSPKACASMVTYKGELILFGGWSHPTPYPLHQAARFFSQLHVYSPETNHWTHVLARSSTTSGPRGIAGHAASVIENKMVVIGGSHGNGISTRNVWVLDLEEMMWEKKEIAGNKPHARYGHSQVVLDNCHILVIGGCGGPNMQFTDVWLLDMSTEPWVWAEMHVEQQEHCPPQLWCHPACKFGDHVAVLSKTLTPRPLQLRAKPRIEEPNRSQVDSRKIEPFASRFNQQFQQLQSQEAVKAADSPKAIINPPGGPLNLPSQMKAHHHKDSFHLPQEGRFSNPRPSTSREPDDRKLWSLPSTSRAPPHGLPSKQAGGAAIYQGCEDDDEDINDSALQGPRFRMQYVPGEGRRPRSLSESAVSQNAMSSSIEIKNEFTVRERSCSLSLSNRSLNETCDDVDKNTRELNRTLDRLLASPSAMSSFPGLRKSKIEKSPSVKKHEFGPRDERSEPNLCGKRPFGATFGHLEAGNTGHEDLSLHSGLSQFGSLPKQPARNIIPPAVPSGSGVGNASPSGSATIGLRSGSPAIRPNAMKDRKKQLEALKRFEERIKQRNQAAAAENPQDGRPSPQEAPRMNYLEGNDECQQQSQPPRVLNPMYLHVLDVSRSVSEGVVTWLPPEDSFTGIPPEERIFYSLASGRAELILFGGIDTDLNTMQLGMNINSQVVSNQIHFIRSNNV